MSLATGLRLCITIPLLMVWLVCQTRVDESFTWVQPTAAEERMARMIERGQCWEGDQPDYVHGLADLTGVWVIGRDDLLFSHDPDIIGDALDGAVKVAAYCTDKAPVSTVETV